MSTVQKSLDLISVSAISRHEAIRKALEIHGRVSTAELAARLGVSTVTIREDLKQLEQQTVLTRTRGGAIPHRGSGAELALELTSWANRGEKRAIGAHAAGLVESGSTVIIDVGSTTTEMAKALSPDLNGVTVITNGLNIALILESMPGITVIVTGGTLRPLQHSLVAPMGTLLLEKLKADVAFVGCNGVDPERGFTNSNIAEAEIKQAMVEATNRAVFLADKSKIGEVAAAFVADIDSADLLVTDAGADQEVLSALHGAGLDIDVVDPAET
jgi:DeoR family transcriptional regulator of aga operon